MLNSPNLTIRHLARAPSKAEPTNSAITSAAPQPTACQARRPSVPVLGPLRMCLTEKGWGSQTGWLGLSRHGATRDSWIVVEKLSGPGTAIRNTYSATKPPWEGGFVSDNCVGFAVQTLSRCAFWVLELINHCTRGLTRGCGLRRYMECTPVRERLGIRGVDRWPLIRPSKVKTFKLPCFVVLAPRSNAICVRTVCLVSD